MWNMSSVFADDESHLYNYSPISLAAPGVFSIPICEVFSDRYDLKGFVASLNSPDQQVGEYESGIPR